MQKRFSFPPLPRTALAIAAAAALALSGCAGSSGSGTPAESYAASGQTGSPSNASSDAASEQARFDAFLAHQFQESVQDDPLSLHFLVRNPENYGITEPEMKFPEYSLEQLQKDSEENAAILEELSSFDTSLLTSDQLFTYRMMKDGSRLEGTGTLQSAVKRPDRHAGGTSDLISRIYILQPCRHRPLPGTAFADRHILQAARSV